MRRVLTLITTLSPAPSQSAGLGFGSIHTEMTSLGLEASSLAMRDLRHLMATPGGRETTSPHRGDRKPR